MSVGVCTRVYKGACTYMCACMCACMKNDRMYVHVRALCMRVVCMHVRIVNVCELYLGGGGSPTLAEFLQGWVQCSAVGPILQ